MWLFMFKFWKLKCLEILVIDYTSLKWFENVLSLVVTLEIWNLTFYNIGNRLHDYGNRLQLCKSVLKRMLATSNQLPVFLNVLIFKVKHEESHLLMCNRLHYDGNRLPVTCFEK